MVVLTGTRVYATALVAAVCLLGACTNTEEPTVPEVPTPTPTATGPDDEALPAPSFTAGVPELCEDLITGARVREIVEVPFRGGIDRVYNNERLEDSGRIGRLTCRYGVSNRPNRPPAVEVAVSAYTSADVAADRIPASVNAARGDVEPQKVQGRPGFILRDKEDVSLLFADDVRTYVITMRVGVVKTYAATRVVLLSLAEAVLPPA